MKTLQNHWHLLLEDPIVRKYTGHTFEMGFKKTTSLGDRVTRSHFVPHSTQTQSPRIYRCGNCNFCPWINTGTRFNLPNWDIFCPKFPADCNTEEVIYLVRCKCSIFYVGKTIRKLKQKLNDHIYYLANNSNLCQQTFRSLSQISSSMISFLVLEVVPKDPRGRNWDKRIL